MKPPATAGWWQRAGRPQLQIFTELSPDSFFCLSLPLMRKQPNYICMLKNLLKLYCIWIWDTLWGFVLFCFVLCGFVLFYSSPLVRQLQNNISGTISRIGGWGMNTKIIKNETSLHLNLEIFFSFSFISIYILSFYTYFLFLFLSLYFLFFIFNCLSVSLMPFQIMVD
jgi:hypothetical protein